MTFFHVKSNLKHNGDEFKAGSFFEGDAGLLMGLINDNVIVAVDADSMEEAREVMAKKLAAKAEAEEIAEEEKPQNTWGPTPTEEKEPEVQTEVAGTVPPAETTEPTGTETAPLNTTAPEGTVAPTEATEVAGTVTPDATVVAPGADTGDNL